MFMQLRALIATFHYMDMVDIVLVAVILYYLYKAIKDTRALSLLMGLVLLSLVAALVRLSDLHTVNWLIQQGLSLIMVALPVVFQPELRRALEKLGRGGLFIKSVELPEKELETLVEEVIRAARNMSRERIGALIAFEREVGLGEINDTGIAVDGLVSRELIENIFVPNTPLHDGAVVISGLRVKSAGCLLPLTSARGLSTELGTRHRAAIGLSEQTDAIVLVVSEETGIISYAYGGHLYRHLQEKQLIEVFKSFLAKPKKRLPRFWKRGETK